jgi:hypothetical protein
VATVVGVSLSAGPAVGEPGPGLAGAGTVTASSAPAARDGAAAPSTSRRPRAASGSHPAPRRSPASGRRTARDHASTSSGPVKPYLIYDSVLPGALPADHVVAVYATGPYAVPASAVRGRKQVLWLDVRGTDPAASVLDIEPGCASPAVAPSWTSDRLSTYPGSLAVLYTSLAEWPLVQAEVAGLPAWMRARIRWWIANPTGYPHLVPGSDATQWYWGSSVDISTATARLLRLAGAGGYARLRRPLSWAIAAASVRLAAPSLARMFDTCTLTVFDAMNSSEPISLLL